LTFVIDERPDDATIILVVVEGPTRDGSHGRSPPADVVVL
jgi:hypothetical protein